MSRYIGPLALILTALSLSNCATTERPGVAQSEWYNNMHKISDAHLTLTPLAADPRKFSDPNNRPTIESKLLQMREAARDLTNDPDAPKADPLITFMSTRLYGEAKRATDDFASGETLWAREAIGHVSNYCISCHTRADRGTKDYPLKWQPNLSALNASQKFDFLLANRQYSSAMKTLRTLVEDKELASSDPESWQKTISEGLALVIRVKNDPTEAEDIARLSLANSGAPYYARKDSAEWIKDIAAWRKEPVPEKPAQKLKLVKRLVEQESRRSRESRLAGLIPRLRASALTYELMERSTQTNYAEALLYSGLLSQSLPGVSLKGLDLFYFENCIRQVPASPLAERCYDKFESAFYRENLRDPESRARLNELRRLAEIKDSDMLKPWQIQGGRREPKGD